MINDILSILFMRFQTLRNDRCTTAFLSILFMRFLDAEEVRKRASVVLSILFMRFLSYSIPFSVLPTPNFQFSL